MAVPLLAGAVVGVALGRINRVSWDQSTGSVVSRMDLLGGLFLVLCMGFALPRDRIVGQWVEDAHTASAIGLALSVRSIAGRIRSLLRGIRNALRVAWLLRQRQRWDSADVVITGTDHNRAGGLVLAAMVGDRVNLGQPSPLPKHATQNQVVRHVCLVRSPELEFE